MATERKESAGQRQKERDRERKAGTQREKGESRRESQMQWGVVGREREIHRRCFF